MSRRLSPENWEQLEPLVDALLEAPRERRAALLAELSGGDGARRSELEHLVAECERNHPLLDRPAAERFAELFNDEGMRVPDSLAERYRLTRELGRGGMAVVYLARDLKHGRDVAVKVIRPELSAAIGRERFLREIEIVAQLHHPHIVPLYDSGEADGFLYYVMPYEEGHSVRERLAREGALPVDDAVVILRDVCDALAHAHQRGIIHRDIKPDNVLLSGRHAMVTDFGVARAVTAAAGQATLTTVGVTLGTPAYMAPEQIAADPHIDHRADIYAVGVLAYELLTGRPPFGGGAPQDVLSAHLAQAPEPLTKYRPDVPAVLAELVMKCLAKRPDERWQHADDLLTRLEGLATSSGRTAAVALPWAPSKSTTAIAAGVVGAAVLGFLVWQLIPERGATWQNAWANAQITPITDFPGSEVDAAISADGKFVAFLADKDSVFDAFVTQVGSGRLVNLTSGRFPQLFNEDVRNVGFTHDAAHVWIRVAPIGRCTVSRMPTLGGALRPFLDTTVMVVWSPNGSKVAYHACTAGDPIHIADSNGRNPRLIFRANSGLHSHYLTWSPDARFLYFAHGVPTDEMDIWRIPTDSGPPERITSHNTRVAYPVLLDDRTLIYTATADDGTGPWLYQMDVEDRVARRVYQTVDQYISIAASADVPGQPRRLVATVSNPSVNLWGVPITSGIVGERAASRIALPTARSAAPRFGPDTSLYYLASISGADGLWRWRDGNTTEVWKASEGAVVGAAAASPDGSKVCFPVRRQGRSTLFCTTAEGTGAHALAESLDVRGAGSWSPDGKWIAMAANEREGVRLYKIPAEGGPPVRLVESVSSNPAWSPDGKFILYSGTPVARVVPVKAVTPEGQPYPLDTLTVDRLGDSYRFLPGGTQLVVKQGGFRRQNFWLVDLATGRRRQLTSLPPGESLHRFDVSPDGKRILFERVRENSNVVLIELPRR